ncbi:MAG: EAL domain-containing protein [Kangiellaceae bacterium]|nr:EAL domain-containing protein [Kangiellaceae bacterium]
MLPILTKVPILKENLICAADQLYIEITENSAIKSIVAGKQTLDLLHQLGIHISVDDFGIGYSSLNYLKSLPADKIKFDRSFIKEMEDDSITLAILESLVPLCKKLSKKTVAEGIETPSQFKLAKQLGFEQVQGYLFSAPISIEEPELMIFPETPLSETA